MTPNPAYKIAYNEAVQRANSLQMDVGIEKMNEFGRMVYRSFLLPKPENRRGHELSCEVVQPGSPLL